MRRLRLSIQASDPLADLAKANSALRAENDSLIAKNSELLDTVNKLTIRAERVERPVAPTFPTPPSAVYGNPYQEMHMRETVRREYHHSPRIELCVVINSGRFGENPRELILRRDFDPYVADQRYISELLHSMIEDMRRSSTEGYPQTWFGGRRG